MPEKEIPMGQEDDVDGQNDQLLTEKVKSVLEKKDIPNGLISVGEYTLIKTGENSLTLEIKDEIFDPFDNLRTDENERMGMPYHMYDAGGEQYERLKQELLILREDPTAETPRLDRCKEQFKTCFIETAAKILEDLEKKLLVIEEETRNSRKYPLGSPGNASSDYAFKPAEGGSKLGPLHWQARGFYKIYQGMKNFLEISLPNYSSGTESDKRKGIDSDFFTK